MNAYLHTAASWAFGFFAIPVCAAIAAGGVMALVGWWNLPPFLKLNYDDAWCGGWLFVGSVILGGIVCYKIFG